MYHEDSKMKRNRLDKVNICRETKINCMMQNKPDEKARERFFRPAYGKKAGGES